MGSDKQQVWLSNMLGSLQKRGHQWILTINIRGWSFRKNRNQISFLAMVDFNPNDSTTTVADVQVLSSSLRAHCWNNHPLKSNMTFPRICQDPVAVLQVARTISFCVTTCDNVWQREAWISPSPTLVNKTNCTASRMSLMNLHDRLKQSTGTLMVSAEQPLPTSCESLWHAPEQTPYGPKGEPYFRGVLTLPAQNRHWQRLLCPLRDFIVQPTLCLVPQTIPPAKWRRWAIHIYIYMHTYKYNQIYTIIHTHTRTCMHMYI